MALTYQPGIASPVVQPITDIPTSTPALGMPGPPAVPIFPAGYGALPTDFDTLVTQPLTFLTNSIVLRVNQSTSQSLSAGSNVIQFNSLDEDPYSGWNAASWEWTAPYSGWYEITVFCSIATTAVGLEVGSSISGGVNGYISTEHQTLGAYMGGGCAVSTVYLVGAVDYVTGIANVTAVASTDVSGIGRYPRMEIAFVSQ